MRIWIFFEKSNVFFNFPKVYRFTGMIDVCCYRRNIVSMLLDHAKMKYILLLDTHKNPPGSKSWRQNLRGYYASVLGFCDPEGTFLLLRYHPFFPEDDRRFRYFPDHFPPKEGVRSVFFGRGMISPARLISVISILCIRSIRARSRPSSLDTNMIAFPSAPARPVRPIR